MPIKVIGLNRSHALCNFGAHRVSIRIELVHSDIRYLMQQHYLLRTEYKTRRLSKKIEGASLLILTNINIHLFRTSPLT
jgi:hypothetical protein